MSFFPAFTNENIHATSASSLRLGAIEFINTLPIYYHLPEALSKRNCDASIHYAPPSRLNTLMDAGELIISPVSSAHYLRNTKQYVLLEDLSVSSFGAVESVLFVSKAPFNKALSDIPTIAVPNTSETSIALLAHLLKQATGQDLSSRFTVYPAEHYPTALAETGAILLIGDVALQFAHTHHQNPSPTYHCTDLAQHWVNQMQTPFVFAVWVAQKHWAQQNAATLAQVQEALVESKQQFFANSPHQQKEAIALAQERSGLPEACIQHYFHTALSYDLTSQHRAGLAQFEQILLPTEALV